MAPRDVGPPKGENHPSDGAVVGCSPPGTWPSGPAASRDASVREFSGARERTAPSPCGSCGSRNVAGPFATAGKLGGARDGGGATSSSTASSACTCSTATWWSGLRRTIPTNPPWTTRAATTEAIETAGLCKFAGSRERTGPGSWGPAVSRDAAPREFAGGRERTRPGSWGPAVSRDAAPREFAGGRERTGPRPRALTSRAPRRGRRRCISPFRRGPRARRRSAGRG